MKAHLFIVFIVNCTTLTLLSLVWYNRFVINYENVLKVVKNYFEISISSFCSLFFDTKCKTRKTQC